jgi:hypothetical protein
MFLEAEGSLQTDGFTVSEKPRKTTETSSHKFQSRIGRLDENSNWVSEDDWQATKSRKASKGEELSEFVIKIDDEQVPERMIILSPYIRKVFMEVVKFFPGVDFTRDSIEMVFPYPPLFHYLADMQTFVGNDKSEDRNVGDFQVLEWYHEIHLKDHYHEAHSFLGLSNVSFEYLWAIFRPGDLVVTRDGLGLLQLHVLTIAEMRKKKREAEILYSSYEEIPQQELVVKAWSIVWFPSQRTFRRSLWSFVIPPFSGSRRVTSLEIYPLRFEDVLTQKRIREELIIRGNIWKKLASERPSCWHYKGEAFTGHVDDNFGLGVAPPPPGNRMLNTLSVS